MCNDIFDIYIGINWGAIEEPGWFGAIEYHAVDIDLVCYEINEHNQIIQTLSCNHNTTSWGKISDDDTIGDIEEDDLMDNEWVKVKSHKIPAGIKPCLLKCFFSAGFFTFSFLLFAVWPP